MTDGYAGYRSALVETLQQKGIHDMAVLRAVATVPRHRFVPEAYRGRQVEEAGELDVLLAIPDALVLDADRCPLIVFGHWPSRIVAAIDEISSKSAPRGIHGSFSGSSA